MTEHDFIAAMKHGLPPIPPPLAPAPAVMLKGNDEIATNHQDAVGAKQEPSPCAI